MAFEMNEARIYQTSGPPYQTTYARNWTAREHLAAMAMQGILASNPKLETDEIASYSFAVADMMIAEAKAREVSDGNA